MSFLPKKRRRHEITQSIPSVMSTKPRKKACKLTTSSFQNHQCNLEQPLLSHCLSASILSNSFNHQHNKNQPWIKKNLSKIHQQCVKFMGKYDQRINVEFEDKKRDPAANAFYNICKQENLQRELINVFNVDAITLNSLDLNTNLVHEVIETKRTKCIECGNSLVRRFRYSKEAKGSIGVKYDNVKGVSITISYVHDCSNPTCDAEYHHNKWHCNGDINFESTKDAYQMNSRATVFADNIIEEAREFHYDDAVSLISYTEKWNKRWQPQIDEIEMKLQSIGLKLGQRCSANASLCPSRLHDAIYMRRLLILLETAGFEKVITKDEWEAYIKKKSVKINAQNSKHKNKLTSIWLNCQDYFNILFDEYYDQLNASCLQYLNQVPIKDGKILLKHFLMGGDCDYKINRASCAFPREIYQHTLKKRAKEGVILRSVKCSHSPQKGNQYADCYSVCSSHLIESEKHGLPFKKADAFCKYSKIQRQIQTTKSAVKLDELQKSIRKYTNDDVQLFKEVRQSLMNGSKRPIRKSRSKTEAKINESVIMLNDTQSLEDIEAILGELNVNPEIVSNPKS